MVPALLVGKPNQVANPAINLRRATRPATSHLPASLKDRAMRADPISVLAFETKFGEQRSGAFEIRRFKSFRKSLEGF